MAIRNLLDKTELHSLLDHAKEQAETLGKPIVAGIRCAMSSVDFLPLFAAAKNEDRFFGEHPDRKQALFALGCATYIEANGPQRFLECAKARAELFAGAILHGFGEGAEERPLLLGGFAFGNREPALDSAWAGFPAARLVLPQLLLTRHPSPGADGAQSALCLYAWVTPASDLAQEGAQLEARIENLEKLLETSDVKGFADAFSNEGVSPAQVIESPDDDYLSAAQAALHRIATGSLEKVVLARACTVETEDSFDAARILFNLRRNYPSCFVFAASRYGISYMGATPERLLALRGDQIISGPLAGSSPRGKTPAQDALFERELRESKKEQAEHAVVVRAIHRALKPYCSKLRVSEAPFVLKLPGIQHLASTLEGVLRNPGAQSILEILGRLHPTPAVGGTPREQALAWIAEHEGLERGWYTGPVGWVNDRGEGDFAIALRAALLRGNKAHLHAGAGIVSGSRPKAELAETRLKMRAALSAILEVET